MGSYTFTVKRKEWREDDSNRDGDCKTMCDT